MLPGIGGIEGVPTHPGEERRAHHHAHRQGEDLDKILGLEYGADDYETKPFNILEVKARIKSIFRRINQNKREQDSQILRARRSRST